MKKRKVVIMVFIMLLLVKVAFSYGFFSLVKKYDINERFGITGKVVDQGTYQDEEELVDKLGELSLNEEGDVYLVIGNEEGFSVSNYENVVQGDLSLGLGESYHKLTTEDKRYLVQKVFPEDNRVEVLIGKEKYEFELNGQENIYFIIQEK